MKVLIIPSWYPDKVNPILGIYFKEQILALNELKNLKIAVLYVKYYALSKISHYLKLRNEKQHSHEKIICLRKYYLNIFPKITWLKKRLIKQNTIKYYKKIVSLYGKPDIIHAHVSYPAGFQALILKNEFNIPIVVTEHATFFQKELLTQYRGITNEVLKGADYYVSVSSFLRDDIINAGRKQCEVIPNFIDFHKFQKSGPQLPKTNDQFTFININDFQLKKGIDILLKSIQKVVYEKKIDAIHFYIVGDGKDKNKYQLMAQKFKIEQYCTFLGRLSNEKVADYLNQSNACVISSRKETFAVVGIEALAAGIPVLSTKCYGPEDYIHENNGILVENDNVEALADGIVDIMNNYKQFNSTTISHEARLKFSKETVAQLYAALYKKVCDSIRKKILY